MTQLTHLSVKEVALTGVFSSPHAVLYVMSFGLWRNWAICLEPIEGIVLGPWPGFLAALIGGTVARMVRPTDLWVFGNSC
jgi:ABC-type thiamin/hydroxymethylpyrimidine transport system permease subunit